MVVAYTSESIGLGDAHPSQQIRSRMMRDSHGRVRYDLLDGCSDESSVLRMWLSPLGPSSIELSSAARAAELVARFEEFEGFDSVLHTEGSDLNGYERIGTKTICGQTAHGYSNARNGGLHEYWYAPDVGVVLEEKLSSSARPMLMSATSLKQGEPEPLDMLERFSMADSRDERLPESATLETLAFLTRCVTRNRTNQRFRQVALIRAVADLDVGHVRDLIAAHEEVNAFDVNGQTALIIACALGHTEMASELLAVPTINVNMSTKNGMTALMFAAASGNLALCEYLVERGADLALVNVDNHTAETIARLAGHADVAKAVKCA